MATSEASLRYTLTQYLTHYHAERNHQGLDNELIMPSNSRKPVKASIHRAFPLVFS
jgi:hypothetical protein